MSVCRHLDCGTGHLPEGEADELRSGGIEHVVSDPYEYGWWIWVPPNITDGEREELQEAAPHLLALIDHARGLGCTHLRLDADADTVDGLPTFEW